MTVEVAARVICRRGECHVRRDASCCLVYPQEGGAQECPLGDQCLMFWPLAKSKEDCPWQAREAA